MSDWKVTEREGGVLIDIVVKPRSSREGLGPVKAERLVIAVNAPPVDGKANQAVIRVLSEALGVPRSQISIAQGETGRRKTLRIEGMTRAALLARVDLG